MAASGKIADTGSLSVEASAQADQGKGCLEEGRGSVRGWALSLPGRWFQARGPARFRLIAWPGVSLPLEIHPSHIDPARAPRPSMMTAETMLCWVSTHHSSPNEASPRPAPQPRATNEPLTGELAVHKPPAVS